MNRANFERDFRRGDGKAVGIVDGGSVDADMTGNRVIARGGGDAIPDLPERITSRIPFQMNALHQVRVHK